MTQIVFFSLSSGGNGGGLGQPAAPPAAGQSRQSAPPAASSTGTPPVAGLGKAPSEKITDYGAAGQRLVDFFDQPGSPASWAMLTPAAQAVYGDESAFQAYWAAHRDVTVRQAHADSGGADDDGSITMNLDVNGPRLGFRMVMVGGQLLIDDNTKLPGT